MIGFRIAFGLIMIVILALCCKKDDEPTESEVSKAAGTYQLTELNVSPPQDINEDGIASTNLLNELPCISGRLSLEADGSYTFDLTGIQVTTITGGQFFIDCAPPRNSSSNWSITGSQITLFADVTTTPYVFVDNTLTRTVGENLPGIQGVVYVKQ